MQKSDFYKALERLTDVSREEFNEWDKPTINVMDCAVYPSSNIGTVSTDSSLEVNQWACGCSLLMGHSCGKEIDATKGLGLRDKETAHRELVMQIKSTIEGEEK